MMRLIALFWITAVVAFPYSPACAEATAVTVTPTVSGAPNALAASSGVETAIDAQTAAAAEPSAAIACEETGGLAAEPSDFLSAFYKTQPSKIILENNSLSAQADGAMVVNGITYKLQSVQIPKVPAIPISSQQYPMEIRFIHSAVDGSTAILSVPVIAGKANPAMENILVNKDAAVFDPNDLLPATRDYASMGKTFGADCSAAQTVQHYLLIHPAEASAGQIQKFGAMFPSL